MRTKSDFIKRLRQSPTFKAALAAAKTPEEKATVAAAAEEFVSSFAEILAPLIERAQNDPEFAAQLGRQLAEQHGVVTSEPAKSGSTG